MKTFVKTHKRLLVGVLAALVLIFMWAWFAGQARQQTGFHQMDDRAARAKTLIKQAYAGTRADRMKAIGSLAGLPQDDSCRGDWWNAWQQLVTPAIKTGAQHCRNKQQTLTAVTHAARAIQQHIADETKVTKLLGQLAVDSGASDWPTKARAAAQSASKALDGIRVVSSVQPIQKAAKTRIEAIITAWNSLNAASEKQDKTAYLTAETQLKQAYANLGAIADTSDTQLQLLLATLSTAARPL